MNTKNYHYAEVPISAPLLKMAIKWNWLGKYNNITRPLLVNATVSLSPFLVLDLMEDQVVSINEDDDALEWASYITLQDIKHLKI